jgi:Mrp family chromosome partitioning ATPase
LADGSGKLDDGPGNISPAEGDAAAKAVGPLQEQQQEQQEQQQQQQQQEEQKQQQPAVPARRGWFESLPAKLQLFMIGAVVLVAVVSAPPGVGALNSARMAGGQVTHPVRAPGAVALRK